MNEVTEVVPEPVAVEEVVETVDMEDSASVLEFFKKDGFTVSIRHHRNHTVTVNGPRLARTGGATTVEATKTMSKTLPFPNLDPEKSNLQPTSSVGFIGVAYCSKNDTYCKKLGVQIALNRALKAYVDFFDVDEDDEQDPIKEEIKIESDKPESKDA